MPYVQGEDFQRDVGGACSKVRAAGQIWPSSLRGWSPPQVHLVGEISAGGCTE